MEEVIGSIPIRSTKSFQQVRRQLLIRVRYTGICGTDVHIYQWDEWAQKTIPVPMAIGHEFVGEIVEVGSNVSDFHPGDMLAAKAMWSAGVAEIAWLGEDISALIRGELA